MYTIELEVRTLHDLLTKLAPGDMFAGGIAKCLQCGQPLQQARSFHDLLQRVPLLKRTGIHGRDLEIVSTFKLSNLVQMYKAQLERLARCSSC